MGFFSSLSIEVMTRAQELGDDFGLTPIVIATIAKEFSLSTREVEEILTGNFNYSPN